MALLGQGSVCFHCRCKRDCQGITTTPISSCIMHACSAYFFQIMAKQQKPVRVEGLFYMCSQHSLTDNVQRASKEVWNDSCSCESTTERFVISLTMISCVRQPIRQICCAPVGSSFSKWQQSCREKECVWVKNTGINAVNQHLSWSAVLVGIGAVSQVKSKSPEFEFNSCNDVMLLHKDLLLIMMYTN